MNKIDFKLVFQITLLFTCLVFISALARAECTKIYTKAGVGFKVEAGRYDHKYRDDPYFLRFEAAVECKNLIFGATYGKQIYTAKSEYFRDNEGYKTALFVDYRVDWEL